MNPSSASRFAGRAMLPTFLGRLQTWLYAWADILDRRPALCVLLLAVATVPYLALKAHANLLSSDEIYTLRIAQQPDWKSLLAASRNVDLHPPLHYLAERLGLATHLPLRIAARLPSIVATLGSLICVFFLVTSRLGSLFGLFAATMLWLSPALNFGWSNRPYALWIFLLSLSALCWQKAAQTRRPAWAFALMLALLAMMLDYFGGIVCIVPFMAAELVRTRRARPAWGIWLALCIPAFACFIYLEQISTFATNSFAPSYLRWFDTTQDIYLGLLTLPAAAAVACIIAAVLLVAHSSGSKPATATLSIGTRFSASETTLAAGIFLLPILLASLAAVHHTQFFTRYGSCGSVGMAILLTLAVYRHSSSPRLVASLASIALVLAAAAQCNDAPSVFIGPWRASVATGVPPLQLAQLDPQVPIVIASPTTFTEMELEEPASIVARTFYLSDRESAIKFSGSTIFENEAFTAKVIGLHGNTMSLASFKSAHHSFYMIANYRKEEEWLPRELISSGAHLQYLGMFPSFYADDDVFLVTLP